MGASDNQKLDLQKYVRLFVRATPVVWDCVVARLNLPILRTGFCMIKNGRYSEFPHRL